MKVFAAKTHRAFADHLDICAKHGVDPEAFEYWAEDFERMPIDPDDSLPREREPPAWNSPLASMMETHGFGSEMAGQNKRRFVND